MRKSSTGFTIVELLIVVVVIAILAAISIVAYTGIQNRARASQASSALTQAKKKLELYRVDNNSFPTTGNLASAGVVDGDTSFQYTSDGTTFCLTATAGTSSYKISNAGSPESGGCAGHGQGGIAAITNLVPNPNFETSTTGWSNLNLAGLTQDNTTGFAGSSAVRFQHSGNGHDGYLTQSSRASATAGTTYSASFSVRKTGTTSTVWPYIIFYNSSNTVIGTPVGTSQSLTSSGPWIRFAVTATAPVGTATATIWVGIAQPPTSDVFYADGFILTQGSSQYSFADGSSPNWVWNGTANNSTSTGPPL